MPAVHTVGVDEAPVEEREDAPAPRATVTVPVTEDLGVILPGVLGQGELEVAGFRCRVRHLKTREFLALMAVITKGFGSSLGELPWSMEGDQMQATLLAALLMAVPNDPDGFIRFVKLVVEPVDPDDAKKLHVYLDNPEIDDLLPIIDAVIENEAENISSLVGKARAFLAKWSQTMKKQRTSIS